MYNNLPNFFFDNPLLQQQVTALLEAYAKQEKTLEQVVKDIEALKDLDPTIRAKVIEIINQMAEDGTLARMVAEILANEPTKAPIDFSRQGRKFFRAVDSNTAGKKSATADSEYYSYTQGGTYFKHNDVNYWLICNVCSNYSHFVNNNIVDVRIYKSNGDFVKARSFTMGHCNDACYYNGNLYFIWNKTNTSGGDESPSRNISMISFENFETDSLTTKTAPTPSELGLIGIDNYNDQFYIADGNCDVYLYNWDTNTATKYITADSSLHNIDVVQNISVNADYVFWLGYRPNCIVRCNRITKKFDYMYTFDNIANVGMYKLGEPQAFKVMDDGTCYLITSMHCVKKAYNIYDMSQFWKQNLYKNNVPASNIPSYDYKNLVITVDGRDGVAQSFNPDGQDGNEFSSLIEAVLFACTQTKYDKINIECLSVYSNQYIYIATNKTINIIGKLKDGLSYVGGLQVDGGNITVQDFTLWNCLASDTPTKKSGSPYYDAKRGIDPDSETYEAYLRDGIMSFSNCTFRTGKPIGIYARRCFINNDGTTYGSGVTNDLNTTIINNSGTVSAY